MATSPIGSVRNATPIPRKSFNFTPLKSKSTSGIDFSLASASSTVNSGSSLDTSKDGFGFQSPWAWSTMAIDEVNAMWHLEVSRAGTTEPLARQTLLSLASRRQYLIVKYPICPRRRYEPLLNEGDAIRLIDLHPLSHTSTIEVTLTNATLSEKPVYCALSYEWGLKIEQRPILVNGHFVHIHKNLYQFLLRLCPDHGVRKIWADAICINQKNIKERNSQVQMMGGIYKAASSVVAWLGEEADSSEMLIRYLKNELCLVRSYGLDRDHYIVGQTPGLLSIPLDDDDKVGALKSLLCRSYWSRAWILQELIHGQDIILQCGDENLSWSYLDALQRNSQAWSKHFENTIIRQIFYHKTDLANGGKLVLLDLMERYPNRQCADLRDQVYSLLSLDSSYASRKRLFDVDYKIDLRSLLFRSFNACVTSRGPASFEILRLTLGLSWTDLLDVSRPRHMKVGEPWLDPQYPWAVYTQLLFYGRVIKTEAISIDGEELLAVSLDNTTEFAGHCVASTAECGDYIFGFSGSSLAIIYRTINNRWTSISPLIWNRLSRPNFIGRGRGPVERLALTSSLFSFDTVRLGWLHDYKHVFAMINIRQWAAVCACLTDGERFARRLPAAAGVIPPGSGFLED